MNLLFIVVVIVVAVVVVVVFVVVVVVVFVVVVVVVVVWLLEVEATSLRCRFVKISEPFSFVSFSLSDTILR